MARLKNSTIGFVRTVGKKKNFNIVKKPVEQEMPLKQN
jgi:hypothetical protein